MHFATLLIVALVAQCSNAAGTVGKEPYLNLYETILSTLKRLNDVEQGKELRENCDVLPGEYEDDMVCLKKWWKDTGCKPEGSYAPDNMQYIDYWLSEKADIVKADMALFKKYADDGSAHSAEYQEICYGPSLEKARELRENCDVLPGEHEADMVCLKKWWSDAGCKPEGSYAPDNNQFIDYWLNEKAEIVKADMALFKKYAEGSAEYKDICFGT